MQDKTQTQERQHTPEPWRLATGGKIGPIPGTRIRRAIQVEALNTEGDLVQTAICVTCDPSDAPDALTDQIEAAMRDETIGNARRIVACVNALAGIDDPAAFVARLAEAEKRVRDRDAELLRCRTHENVAAVTLDKTLNREQRDALKVAADLLAVERQRVKRLTNHLLRTGWTQELARDVMSGEHPTLSPEDFPGLPGVIDDLPAAALSAGTPAGEEQK